MFAEKTLTDIFFQTHHKSPSETKEYYYGLRALRARVLGAFPEIHSEQAYYTEPESNRTIFYQIWFPKKHKTSPKALIFLIHDQYLHSDYFYPLADYLTAHEILVIGVDLLKHGRSLSDVENLGTSEEKDELEENGNSIYRWKDNIPVLHQLIQKFREPTIPTFFLGEGVGALVGLHLLQDSEELFQGLMLLSPAWEIRANILKILNYPILSLRSFLQKNKKTKPPEPDHSRVIPEFLDYWHKDILRLPSVPLQYQKATYEFIFTAQKLTKSTACPLIIFQGTEDRVSDPFYIHEIYSDWEHLDKKIRLYDNTSHHILYDKYSREIYREILEFCEEHKHPQQKT